MNFRTLLLAVTLSLSTAIQSQDSEGFLPLFNGKDLSGWRPVNVASDTFRWENGMMITTGVPTGFMATEKMYENFIVELEWRHMKEAGNSGVFIWGEGLPAPGVPYARGIEVQVLDLGYEKNKGAKEWFTSHGDIFPIWGATMTPVAPIAQKGSRSFPREDRVKPSPEWNHYRIECNQGEIKLSVNGKEVTVGRDCFPRKGYLCLESEGSEAHFRNVRIKELPSSNVTPELIARGYEGFRQIFNGKDLGGWKVPAEGDAVWTARGSHFVAKADPAAAGKDLWSEAEFGDFTLCVDFQLKGANPTTLPVSGIYLRGDKTNPVQINLPELGSGSIAGQTPTEKVDLKAGGWNRFFITVKGQTVTVELNDKIVLKEVALPNLPAKGPVGLQHLGAGVEFANLFIKKL
jgi:hypothetical protein